MKILSDVMMRGIVKYLNQDMELHCVVSLGNKCAYRLDIGKLETACDEAAFCGEEDVPDAAWEAFQAAVTASPELSRLRKIMANVDGHNRGVSESHRAVADFWDAVETDYDVHQLYLASLQLGEPRASATGVFLGNNKRRTRSMNKLRTATGFTAEQINRLAEARKCLGEFHAQIAAYELVGENTARKVRDRLQDLIEEKLEARSQKENLMGEEREIYAGDYAAAQKLEPLRCPQPGCCGLVDRRGRAHFECRRCGDVTLKLTHTEEYRAGRVQQSDARRSSRGY